MKVLVCGSRTVEDFESVSKYLDAMHSIRPITVIVSGAARGADSLGEQWARNNSVRVNRHPAQWDTLGKAAGFIRNEKMIATKPDEVVAFVDKPLHASRGTAHMVGLAEKRGIATSVFQLSPMRGGR